MIWPKEYGPAALRLNMPEPTAWLGCLLLLIPFTANSLGAQTGCQQDQVLNRLAVEFQGGKPKMPVSFSLVNAGTPRALRIEVTNPGDGFWICDPCEGLIGREHMLKPELDIPGYSIAPVRGVNRPLRPPGGKCYAFFSFNAKKTSWTIEVSPKPAFPFQYSKNNEVYPLRSPQSGTNWKLITPLLPDDVVKLKLYEVRGSKTIYLFSLDVLWDFKALSRNADQIADRILEEREVYRYGNASLADDLDPADPYLEIATKARISNSDRANALSRTLVKDLLKLQKLELLDKTEVP